MTAHSFCCHSGQMRGHQNNDVFVILPVKSVRIRVCYRKNDCPLILLTLSTKVKAPNDEIFVKNVIVRVDYCKNDCLLVRLTFFRTNVRVPKKWRFSISAVRNVIVWTHYRQNNCSLVLLTFRTIVKAPKKAFVNLTCQKYNSLNSLSLKRLFVCSTNI